MAREAELKTKIEKNEEETIWDGGVGGQEDEDGEDEIFSDDWFFFNYCLCLWHEYHVTIILIFFNDNYH